MWEKLKDILYEISDILFALIIILLMSTIITWKITDSLAYSKDKNSLLNKNPIRMDNSASHSKKADDPDAIESEEETGKQEDTENHSASLSPAAIQVDIPNGTPAANIAEILKDKDLIQNTHNFIARIEQRQLSNKLKSGTFQIKKESSLDEIIDILTGQN